MKTEHHHHQSASADCRLPIADCRLPIADCRLLEQATNQNYHYDSTHMSPFAFGY
jgi:hypothetical protein